MKKYSIIVPHRNSLNLLERAIKSIPNRSDVEIIIVDNSIGDVDLSGIKILNNNICVFSSDIERGAGGARNVGIENARGQWLLFLDADDFFVDTAFESFDTFANSDYEIVFFKWTSCYSDTLEPASRDLYYNKFIDSYINKQIGSDLILRYKLDTPCAKLISRKLIIDNNILFDECISCNDAFFSTKIGFYANVIMASSSSVYCATVNKGSITNTRSLAMLESRFLANLRVNRFLSHHNLKKARRPILRYIVQAIKYGLFSSLKFIYWSVKYENNLLFGLSSISIFCFRKHLKKVTIDKRYIVKR